MGVIRAIISFYNVDNNEIKYIYNLYLKWYKNFYLYYIY